MLENSNNTGHEPEYLAIFMCAILAALGGIARELSNFEACFNLRRFLSNIFISSFSGIIIGLFLPDFDHKNWVLAAAGCAGLCGCAIVDYLVAIFKTIILHVASSTIGKDIKVKERTRKTHKRKVK